jgi:hypothetical protein
MPQGVTEGRLGPFIKCLPYFPFSGDIGHRRLPCANATGIAAFLLPRSLERAIFNSQDYGVAGRGFMSINTYKNPFS